MIKAKTVKFIKLGRSGGWEKRCIVSNKPMIRLGFNNPHHQKCLDGDWDFINRYWLDSKTKKKATETTNQIKNFYTQPSTTMWVTFFKRKLYWCFAKESVIQLEDGSRIREVDGQWQSCNIKGEPLYIENLSGKLTKTQMFRGTICSVKESNYLLNRINALELPEVQKANDCLSNLVSNIKPVIKNLGWQDFELLVDLVFSNAGWQRIATLGKAEKSIDLDVIFPVTGRRAFVQVKSQSSKNEFKDYIEQFEGMPQYDEMYYICHTGTSAFNEMKLPNNIQLIGLDHMAELTVNAGLVKWLITKAS
ncbi:MAG: restriction endonuclease [Gammaproteobacteria bacterium]|nr:restriction endonuclease [Gammaproteobacteria bacterium]